jgi:cyclophilin family peptidyl-prolyl cis-trans isomerase
MIELRALGQMSRYSRSHENETPSRDFLERLSTSGLSQSTKARPLTRAPGESISPVSLENAMILSCRACLTAAILALAGVGCTDRASSPSPVETVTTSGEIADDPAIRYDEPFAKAVTDEIGPDQLPPLDRTVAGRSIAAVRGEVERLWPTIRLTDAAGKPLAITVLLETDAGLIEIALRADVAPNHVRNLIALVRAGYYDGLRFDRIVQQQAEAPDGTRSEIRLVRFGCPAGTGDPGIGHIGYRLRSEFSDVKHEAGTVGFTRDADPSSAGTRLYITLGPTPVLDGNYTVIGKVKTGLDVVEKIAAGKLLPPDVDPTRELPERPVVIKSAILGRNP